MMDKTLTTKELQALLRFWRREVSLSITHNYPPREKAKAVNARERIVKELEKREVARGKFANSIEYAEAKEK